MTVSDTDGVSFGAPRRLSGGGDPSIVTTHLREHGWRELSEPLSEPGRLGTGLESPDATIQLCLDPDPERPWWTVLGIPPHGPLWHATFQVRTPAELILAFTQALTHPAEAPDTAPFRSCTTPAGPGPSPTSRTTRGSHRVRCRIHGTPLWSAVLSLHTPLPAVTSFGTALADTGLFVARRFLDRTPVTAHPTAALPARPHPTPAALLR